MRIRRRSPPPPLSPHTPALGAVSVSRATVAALRQFLPLFAVSLLLHVPYVLAVGGWFGLDAALRSLATGVPPIQESLPAAAGAVLVVAGIVTEGVTHAVLVKAADDALGAGRVDLRTALASGLERGLPACGVAVLATLGILLGLNFFLAPGVVFACTWFVATPACVLERRGLFASLERSAALTRGRRWSLALPVVGAFCLIALDVQIGESDAIRGSAFLPLALLVGAFFRMVVAGTTVAVYRTLLREKEARVDDEVIRVFE